VAAVLVALVSASGPAPQLINFQGRLTDAAGKPLQGDSVDLIFNFYGSESGSTVLLTVLEEGVALDNGQYSVLIGGGTITAGVESDLASVFQNHGEVWMGITVNGDEEMAPRSRITSVPYALAVETKWLTSFLNADDFDADGFPKACPCDGSTAATDCDDGNADVHPGAAELCDGIDNQCPGDAGFGEVDEGCGSGPSTGCGTWDAGCAPGASALDADTVYTHGQINLLAADDTGHVYTYWDNGLGKEIWKIDQDGVKTVFSTEVQLDTVSGDMHSLYADCDNVLWAIKGNNIISFDEAGDPTVFFADGASLGFNAPVHLAADTVGNFYVSNSMGSDPKVFKIDPEGNGSIAVPAPADPTGFGAAHRDENREITYKGNGFFTWDGSTHKLYRSDLETELINAWDALYPIPGNAIQIEAKLWSQDWEFDCDFQVYGEGRISYIYDPGGGYTGFQDYFLFRTGRTGDVEILNLNDNHNFMVWRSGNLYVMRYDGTLYTNVIYRYKF
jgi:hypothetical protein